MIRAAASIAATMVPTLALLLTGCSGAGGVPARDAGRASASTSGARVMRVVSINPCVDAILMEVADPGQIAGISHYSHDARATSIPLDVARRFPATSGTAEEVVALSPDLVIAGGHVAPSTLSALARMNIPLVQVGVPESIAESSDQIRTIAAAIGRRAQGAALVHRIDAAVTAARPPHPADVPALIWQGGGMVPGTGTLADELLRVSGYRNMSDAYGLKRWDVLPLEPLVARPPRVLLSVGADGRDDRMLAHPVLDRLRARVAVRSYPDRLMHCGGPTIVAALDRLARIRRTL